MADRARPFMSGMTVVRWVVRLTIGGSAASGAAAFASAAIARTARVKINGNAVGFKWHLLAAHEYGMLASRISNLFL
jgi:uncharacterized membrane protein